MKFLWMLFLLQSSYAAELKFDRQDQLKMAELLKLLPEEIRNAASDGVKVISRIEEESAWSISCEAFYYRQSPYASKASCRVEVDEYHDRVQRSYDEIKVILQDKTLASALYQVIPGGPGRREFRSWGRDNGVTFSGKSGQIFHYFVSCLPESCEIKLSEKALGL